MCSVVAGLMGLSGLMQYQGQKEAADAQAASYRNSAEMANRNARIENRVQEQIADNAAIQDRRLRDKAKLQQAQVRAAAGAAGISSAGGSPFDILSGSWDAYQQDKMISLSNQRNENYNRRVNQSNFENMAASYNAAADNTKRVARMQGLATLLGTATAIADTGAFDNINFSSGSSGSKWNAGNAPTKPTSWTAGGGYKVQFPYGGPTYNIGNPKVPWLGK